VNSGLVMRRYVDALYEHVVLIDVDPALISRFQLGLVIGLVWITTLSFFPGTLILGDGFDEPNVLPFPFTHQGHIFLL